MERERDGETEAERAVRERRAREKRLLDEAQARALASEANREVLIELAQR